MVDNVLQPMLILPEVGLKAPDIIFITFVLPEPFGPMTPTISFLFTWKSKSETAVNPPKVLVTFWIDNSLVPIILSAFLISHINLLAGQARHEAESKQSTKTPNLKLR